MWTFSNFFYLYGVNKQVPWFYFLSSYNHFLLSLIEQKLVVSKLFVFVGLPSTSCFCLQVSLNTLTKNPFLFTDRSIPLYLMVIRIFLNIVLKKNIDLIFSVLVLFRHYIQKITSFNLFIIIHSHRHWWFFNCSMFFNFWCCWFFI